MPLTKAACPPRSIWGHVAWLMDKCDYIFVPRSADMGRDKEFCLAVAAPCRMWCTAPSGRRASAWSPATLPCGKAKARPRPLPNWAKSWASKTAVLQCLSAGQTGGAEQEAENARKLDNALARSDLKVLICGHAYNIYDRYVGSRCWMPSTPTCTGHSGRLGGPGRRLAGRVRPDRHHALDGQPGTGRRRRAAARQGGRALCCCPASLAGRIP